MPDPDRRTVSATEMPMLLNVSHYGTAFMLYRRFHDGVDIGSGEDARMSWGRKMQPLIREQAASDLSLEIVPNDDDIYQRQRGGGPLGATRDATMRAPDRGDGAFEIKCCFDYRTWMNRWHGGKAPPKEYEIQLQQQMLVGDGTTSFKHGTICVWVCGELIYFHRDPIPALWTELVKTGAAFLNDVAQHRRPDPFGDPIEAPFLAMIERPPDSVIDLTGDPSLADKVRQYAWEQKQARVSGKSAASLKSEIIAAMGANREANLDDGITVKLLLRKRGDTPQVVVKTFIPNVVDDGDQG